MKSYHVILDGQLYRLTRESWKRVLLVWARSGERPDFTAWKGVRPLADVLPLEEWTLRDVESELLDWLRAGRDRGTEHAPDPVSDTPEATSSLVIQPMGDGTKLLQIVNSETGEIKASGLTMRQAERMIQEGVK